MFQPEGTTIVQKRMSFLSVMALGASSVVIVITLSLTGIIICGMRLIDKKTDNLAELLGETVKSLPALRESLPPALTDVFNDERRPDYLQNLVISTKRIEDEAGQRWPQHRVAVQVQNNGDASVTLLSMRVIGLDANGEPVQEWHTWAATPLQLDHDWRGPLLPHETRRFVVRCGSSDAVATVTHEVSDIRLWLKDGPETPAKPLRPPQEPPSAPAT